MVFRYLIKYLSSKVTKRFSRPGQNITTNTKIVWYHNYFIGLHLIKSLFVYYLISLFKQTLQMFRFEFMLSQALDALDD